MTKGEQAHLTAWRLKVGGDRELLGASHPHAPGDASTAGQSEASAARQALAAP